MYVTGTAHSYCVTFTVVNYDASFNITRPHKHGILAIVAPKKASQGYRYVSKIEKVYLYHKREYKIIALLKVGKLGRCD